MKDVNRILVWHLSEANKGTKVEISASTRRTRSQVAVANGNMTFDIDVFAAAVLAKIIRLRGIDGYFSSASTCFKQFEVILTHFAFTKCAYLITGNNILVEKDHNNNASEHNARK